MRYLTLLLVLLPSFVYASEVKITTQKEIDPASFTEELMQTFPASGVHGIVYDKDKGEIIIDFPISDPTQQEIQSVLDSHDSKKKENERKQKKGSVIQKLKGLGLTQDEIDVILPR